MKPLVSIIALTLAVAFTTPAFAQDRPMNKADCEKAVMKWDDAAKNSWVEAPGGLSGASARIV